MYQHNQRLTLDLSSLMIKGVFFSQNVQKAIGTIVQQISTTPPVYLVELEIGTRPLAATLALTSSTTARTSASVCGWRRGIAGELAAGPVAGDEGGQLVEDDARQD